MSSGVLWWVKGRATRGEFLRCEPWKPVSDTAAASSLANSANYRTVSGYWI